MLCRFFIYFTTAVFLLTVTACGEDLDRAPAFVEVADLRLEASSLPLSAQITEVWAFANNEFVGAFNLPARIPVHAVGATELRFEAGVRQNGISAQPEIYPFYTTVSRTLDLVAGSTTELGALTVRYRDDAQFAFVEGFEDGGERLFTDLEVGLSGFERITNGARSGSFAGRIQLDEDNPRVDLRSGQIFRDLNGTTNQVWLEIDYRSSANGIWGFEGGQFRQFDPGFNARDEYQKIYYNLTPLVNAIAEDELRLLFATALPPGETEAEVILDNIRLIHF